MRDLYDWSGRNRWQILILAGVLIRTLMLLKKRPFWLDETSLYGNIVDRSIYDMLSQLKSEQVVPPGFLMLLRCTYQIMGQNEIALRALPFLSGIMALILFLSFCREHFSGSSGFVCAALFTLNSDLIYYCQEMKPYAMDVLVGVLAMRMLMKSQVANESSTVGWEWWALALSPWFSIAGLFNIVGLAIMLGIKARRNLSRLRPLLIVSIVWVVSFGICYRMEGKQVSPNSGLWVFWHFAFLKWDQPRQNIALLLDNLINPLHFLSSFSNTPIMMAWAGCVVLTLGIGWIRLRYHSRLLFEFISICLGGMGAASLLRLYPSHGRTLISITPFVICIFGEGVRRLREKTASKYRDIVWLLLITPLLSFAWSSPLKGPRPVLYDGDLEPDHFMHAFGIMSERASPISHPISHSIPSNRSN
ncbi:MAG: hypothetical protein NT172_19480 [Planctomycetota bacterium]|nr:hypothetical protein [Planctomycetota bacterium]